MSIITPVRFLIVGFDSFGPITFGKSGGAVQGNHVNPFKLAERQTGSYMLGFNLDISV